MTDALAVSPVIASKPETDEVQLWAGSTAAEKAKQLIAHRISACAAKAANEIISHIVEEKPRKEEVIKAGADEIKKLCHFLEVLEGLRGLKEMKYSHKIQINVHIPTFL
jgi:PBP1b-binding outer membrane lipoprotein LpoB